MTTGLRADSYVLEIRLASEGGVARSLQVLSKLTAALESMDNHLVVSANALVDTVLTIEAIEYGSIRLRLASFLKSIDDEGLKELDFKKVIGAYLVKAKHQVVKLLEGKPSMNQLQVVEVQAQLLDAARSTGIDHLPTYTPPSVKQIAGDIEAMQQALEPLELEDRVTYISTKGRATFNQGLRMPTGTLENLLTKETLISHSEMILQVKKMDLLGDSQWEFRHAGKSINARICDYDWLQRFRARQEPVLAGDSLRAVMEMAVSYGIDNDVIKTRYIVTRVIEVLPAKETQTWLPLDDEPLD